MAQRVEKKSARKERSGSPFWLLILFALPPAALITLFYIYIDSQSTIEWVETYIAAPYRGAAATVTSFGPFQYFSLAEIIITLLVIWVLIFLIKTIVIVARGPGRVGAFFGRIFVLVIVAAYLFAAYSWLWDAGYRAESLAEKTGLTSDGITVEQLESATRLFAEKANELSEEVSRDEDGHFDEEKNYYFALSKGLYANITDEIPALDGKYHTPKRMIYSKLMSLTGFTGVYIAITGEANVNVDAPGCLVPFTIAHEMAHQRGVHAEEEANFSAVAACITSNITVYEYSGYLGGLIYLSSALYSADPDAANEILATLNDNVRTDWADNNEYWQRHETAATEAVTAAYDSYLKYNEQDLGVSSYGACVDMIVTWLETRAA